MRYIKILVVAVSSALISAYTVLWFVVPTTVEAPNPIVVPPVKVEQTAGHLLIWGAWETQNGYDHSGKNAIEIRCDQASASCSEAYASVLQHDDGEDLEAQVFNYVIKSWTDFELRAVSERAMGECLTRQLIVDIHARQAHLEWGPSDGCEGDVSAARLVGDPL